MTKTEIMVVEDTEALRDEMALMLELEGFAVRAAANGREALEMLADRKPALILCDVMMPDMDGHTFAKKVRAKAEYADVPFVFVSALSAREHVRAGMMLGADDYIPKPFTSDELMDTIRIRLKRTESVAESYQEKLDELQGRLAGAQKKELLGQIAGGLVHDFNNLITIISTYANLATGADGETALQQDLTEIRDASKKAAGLSRRILGLVRTRARHETMVDLQECLTGLVDLLGRVLPRDIRLVTDFSPVGGRVFADAQDLEQVFLNLVINSRDALRKGGEILIQCAPSPIFVGGDSSRGVRVSVTDDGPGIAEEVRDRVFEPFFTTHSDEQHSGLGLATVKRTVEQLGGTVSLDTDFDAGTRIHVDLPFPTETL